MTKEEAMNKWIIPAIRDIWNDKKCDEIIKALDQGLCDDCVSRQAAIDAICKDCAGVDYDYCYKCDELIALRALPSATPQPKTGHWIECNVLKEVKCSNCRRCFRDRTNYCPNCGSKMEEELQWFDIA